MGKGSRLPTVEREWDGIAGNHLAEGNGRKSTISWLDTERDGIMERVGNRSGKSGGYVVGKSANEHNREIGREQIRENGRELNREEFGHGWLGRRVASRCSPE